MAMLAFLRRAAQRSTAASSSSAATAFAVPSAASFSTRARRAASAAPLRELSAPSLFSSQTRSITRASQPQVAYVANDVTGVLAAVAVVGALIGVGKMWWDASSSPASGGAPRANGAVQDISRDDIKLFFVDLKASITELFSQLPQINEQFGKHLESQNVQLSDEEYKQTLLQQLFDVLQNIEQQVVGARGWDRDSFALAMEKFADDDEIAQLQKELQEIMQSVFPAPEIPDHITPEKTLEILAILTKGMEDAMVAMLKHARAEGITDPTKAMQEFQQIYVDQVEQITFDTMKKHDVAAEIFNVALQKFYSEDAEFRKQVEQIYAKQAEAFRRLGLDVATN